jgi:ornithine cyclodeaminase/alanine dehydrogenase-like protein (mu-crystallin family)
MELRVLTEGDLRQALDMPAAIQAVRQAFVALSGGGARVPVRQRIEGPGATLLSMPGTLSAPGSLGAKLVTVAPDNRRRGLPAIHAVVVLLDPTTGVPRALLDGEWLTALRTGAGTGVATDLLAPPNASVLGVVGAGPQARTQMDAVRAVRPLTEIRIASRGGDSARRLAEEAAGAGVEGVRAVATAAEAIRGAQIVVTATDSSEPVLDPDALEPTVLINAVGGYRRDMQEVPTVVTARARVVVDQVEAALREAGDVWIPCEAGVLRPEELEELGALAALTGGETPGAEARPGVTLFKSVGNAVQDLAVAALALERAEALGLGTVVRG